MLDIAIVGGGVAGCYCVHRLAEAAYGDIALFEATGRIGGRLWSVPVGASGGAFAEIGGMFFRENQRNVVSLVQNLGLTVEPVAFERAGQYVRGIFFKDTEFSSVRLPFNLSAEERKGGPAALLLHALEKLVPGVADVWPINREPPRSAQATFQRLRAASHNGRPLHHYALWNVLTDVIGTEAYALLASSLGTASLIRGVNAFDGVWSLLHEIGDGPGLRLRDGYQGLPRELARRAEAAGANIQMNHCLSAISRERGAFRLAFARDDGAETVVLTRGVVLAMPQRALKRVTFEPGILENPEAFERARDLAVSPVRSCKLFLTYERAWWETDRSDGAAISARYTDLPMQQCYSEQRVNLGGPNLLMAVYADDVSASFWPPLAAAAEQHRSVASLAADASALSCSDALVAAAATQLDAMHADRLPAPNGALYFDWGRDPHGGAWHAWAPHFKSWEIRPWMRRPNPHLDLFICGEAYSQRNGWVEGAINSAERTLEQLGLTRPGWISDPDFQFEIDDKGEVNDDRDTANVQRAVTGHGVAA